VLFAKFIDLLVSVSEPARVARVPVVGNVKVVVAVAVSVVLNAPAVASVELLARDNVPVVVDTVKPFILVAVAAPKVGVTRVGLVPNTKAPEPVSSETAVANCADVIVMVLEPKLIDLFVSVSVVALPTKVSVAAGRVNVFVPAIAVAVTVIVPDVEPFSNKFLPVAKARFSEEVQAEVAEDQFRVLSVAPFRVIPPPLAVVSVGVPVLPNSILISATLTVVEFTVVVVPLTVKLPVTVKLLLTVVVPVEAPIETVVAAPPMFSVVTVALNTEAVVLVVVIAGDAPLRANDVALVAVIVGLPRVNVPVEAPIETAVAAPNNAPVNALVLNTEAVPVEVVVIDGDAPFIVNEVALG
jgi:hypothetical protein